MRDSNRLTLKEISSETVRQICDREVNDSQREYVAPNAVSMAQAYFCKEAWFRAIYQGEIPVGFAMVYEDPGKPEYYLWRFMIDRHHQGKGYGKEAMELIIAHVKTRPNATELSLSCDPGEEGPENFYRKLGFEPTGEFMGTEKVMRLSVSSRHCVGLM